MRLPAAAQAPRLGRARSASGVDGTGRAVLRDHSVVLEIVGFGFVLTGLTYLTERKRTAIP